MARTLPPDGPFRCLLPKHENLSLPSTFFREPLSFRLYFFLFLFFFIIFLTLSLTENENALKPPTCITLAFVIRFRQSVARCWIPTRERFTFIKRRFAQVQRIERSVGDEEKEEKKKGKRKNAHSFPSARLQPPLGRAVSFPFPFQRWLDCEKS